VRRPSWSWGFTSNSSDELRSGPEGLKSDRRPSAAPCHFRIRGHIALTGACLGFDIVPATTNRPRVAWTGRGPGAWLSFRSTKRCLAPLPSRPSGRGPGSPGNEAGHRRAIGGVAVLQSAFSRPRRRCDGSIRLIRVICGMSATNRCSSRHLTSGIQHPNRYHSFTTARGGLALVTNQRNLGNGIGARYSDGSGS
jgi:hypothetical protein